MMDAAVDFKQFVLDNTFTATPPLTPEIYIHIASAALPLWQKFEDLSGETNTPPPFWAFAWAGGQALARYILDHPEIVRGQKVLDFGAGSGIVAVAAAMAGAAVVEASDIDPVSLAATEINARENHVHVVPLCADVIGQHGWSVLLIGDTCYEKPLAERLYGWLKTETRSGVHAYFGDPGRNYFLPQGLKKLAGYDVPTPRDLEDREMRKTGVYLVL